VILALIGLTIFGVMSYLAYKNKEKIQEGLEDGVQAVRRASRRLSRRMSGVDSRQLTEL